VTDLLAVLSFEECCELEMDECGPGYYAPDGTNTCGVHKRPEAQCQMSRIAEAQARATLLSAVLALRTEALALRVAQTIRLKNRQLAEAKRLFEAANQILRIASEWEAIAKDHRNG